MAKHLLPLLVTVAAIVLTSTVTAQAPAPAPAPEAGGSNSTTTLTAYEMLSRYDFPPGVLQQDGSFQVNFPDDCHLRVAKQYSVRYSSRVAGKIQNDSISGLEGVKVKVLFAWVGIGEVGRDGDKLKLKAGLISQSF